MSSTIWQPAPSAMEITTAPVLFPLSTSAASKNTIHLDPLLQAPGSLVASRAPLKEMATGIKAQDSKPSLELPSELPYEFLKKITNDFSDERKISGSPFGTLYKGIVPDDGKVIAVKKLQENAAIPADRHLKNRYIQADVTESLLCYEYLPNVSLKDNLFGIEAAEIVSPAQRIIDWDRRFKIIKGICQGLCFLHKLDIPIIHMDLKPENILLGANNVPKIADFALSRVFGQEQTRLCTQTVVGSYGYMAPKYLYRGEISAKSDIYSLGLMIIEITTREENYPEDKQPSARKIIEKVHNTWTP
uniref:Uncharacterized protein n=1 Tax=Avena sativa TaxID=4498 RepID=A0ACD5UKA8_AVESA